MSRFVGLIILDGFGLNSKAHGNAIKLANPVNFNSYLKNYPSCKLDASGTSVGLPKGQIGNSEVGHLNIGAGRVVKQKLLKINELIANKSFFHNKQLLNTLNHVESNGSNLHIMGLLSDGGVHSHINHLFALLELIKKQNFKRNVFIHCFLDGRDTFRQNGVLYLQKLIKKINSLKLSNVKIASVMGRYYAMDREANYNLTQKAYKCLVLGNAEVYSSDPINAVENSYKNGIFDEFVEPIAVVNAEKCNTIASGDGVIFYNFREDRARQLTASLTQKFSNFATVSLKNVYFTTFANYDENFKNLNVAFIDENLEVNLSQVLSKNGLKQFKIAETTKYAHVTYFLNGGIEAPYKNENRFLIETLKDVSFDSAPQMRAVEITDKAIKEILSKKHHFMALNYSNCDMVGHTGNLQAAVKAVKCVDEQLKRVVDAILSVGGVAVITADHGNVESMIAEDGKVLTDHTTNKVPFIIVGDNCVFNLKNGKLANVAPTVLQLLNISKPVEFVENSLIEC